eukprot:6213585-Pleurochrysis_carterae.AAC.8
MAIAWLKIPGCTALPHPVVPFNSNADGRPVGLALYGRSNRKSGVTPEAEYSGIDAPTRGVVNI